MNNIQKALKKLNNKEKGLIKEILQKLTKGQIKGLDIKKLKNINNIYRVRKGKLRIIYKVVDDKIFILSIERRSDTTYNFK